MPLLSRTSFAGGEIAPDLYGRSDIERHSTCQRALTNFIVTPTGVLKNRSGTIFVRGAKTSTPPRLVPFVFNKSQSYILECGPGYVRFHRDGITLADPGDPLTPYELSAPWEAADLPLLRWAQQNDLLVITIPGKNPVLLRRLADDAWTVDGLRTDRGVNPPTNLNLTPSGSNINPSGLWGTLDSERVRQNSPG